MAKILVVDDTEFMRLNIRTTVERNGFTVIAEAENGEEGVKKYKEYKPDLVMMDITMPKMNGIQAVKEIMAYDPKAKIIMVSAMGQETYIREAILSGAKTFIVKPFTEVCLIETLIKISTM